MLDPRDGTRKALKKMPNVFQNTVSCRRVYRELKMLTAFNHDNVSNLARYVVDLYHSQSRILIAPLSVSLHDVAAINLKGFEISCIVLLSRISLGLASHRTKK